MSEKTRREMKDEDSEVGDSDYHTVQSDRGRSLSSLTSIKSRKNEEDSDKELIHVLSSNQTFDLNRKAKKTKGSAELVNLYASLLPSTSSYQSTKTADEKDRQNTSAIAASIEFVKHFRGHLVDMITMVKIDYIPLMCSFVYSFRQALSILAVSSKPIKIIPKICRASPVSIISYCPKYDIAISCDQSSIISYWSPDDIDNLSSEILFKSKLNTDLIELVKRKLIALILEFNVSDEQFALIEKSLTQRKLFLFDTLKGKIF
ncbi:unnamed protein product [Rotaria sp. Silwood1]|nr:unnamed protein product [Rotaria sp. Silwood1]